MNTTELVIILRNPKKNISLTLPEEAANRLFGDFAFKAIAESLKPVNEEPKADEPEQKEQAVKTEKKADLRPHYLIKCQCGEMKFIQPKYQLKHFLCRKCFAKTPMDTGSMIEARVRCHHCGNGFNALTNCDSDALEPNCPKCGESIRLVWDGSQGLYNSVEVKGNG